MKEEFLLIEEILLTDIKYIPLVNNIKLQAHLVTG